MSTTKRQVNNAIAEKWPELELSLERGNGYYYVVSDNEETSLKLAGLYTTSIPVYSIQHMTLAEWLTAVEYVLKDSDRLPCDQTPLI